MLWAFAAGSIGLLLGLWFRVPALITASVATVALCLLTAPFAELSPVSTAGLILALLSVLQGGYLVGLVWSRFRGREQFPRRRRAAARPGAVLGCGTRKRTFSPAQPLVGKPSSTAQAVAVQHHRRDIFCPRIIADLAVSWPHGYPCGPGWAHSGG